MDLKMFLWIVKWLLGLAGKLPFKREFPVLIVEDCIQDSEPLEWCLEREGCQFVTVRNVAEAREALRHQKFRFVFMDDRLPDGSGIELAVRMRSQYENLPIILYLGDTSVLVNLPDSWKWSFIPKGTVGGSLTQPVHQAILEANGMNGHVPMMGVFIVSNFFMILMFFFGLYFWRIIGALK